MREIKFRYYNKIRKEMIYSDKMAANQDQYNDFILEEFFHALRFERQSNILMQYTGLKDKNGEEIYEGDIVSDILYSGNKAKQAKYLCEVVFINSTYYLRDKDDIWKFPISLLSGSFEVIGNIYENPKLMKNE